MSSGFEIPSGCEELSLWAYRKGVEIEIHSAPAPECEELRFAFRPLTAGLWDEMETAALRETKGLGRYCDHGLLRIEYLRRCLVAWNLDFPLSFDSAGNLTKTALSAVLSLHPALVREISGRVFSVYQTEEERKEIEREAAILFGAHQSVSDAHPLVALYCQLEAMWEKFGLNYFDLQRLPARERNALRQIAGLENSARVQERENEERRRQAPMGRRW